MKKGVARRVVVKVGTGVLTSGVGCLDTVKMRAICSQIAAARETGVEVALVSSGAVGLGMGRLGLKARPKQIRAVQKCAAVGQGILIQTWEELFEPYGLVVAQLLLTRDDVDNIQRAKALGELIDELLRNRIIPVVNENDSLSAAELNIKFGDNDVLSALVATLCKATDLVILSTAAGLLNKTGDGKMVKEVAKVTPEIRAMAAGTTSATAVGGMITKIKAAEIATSEGCGVYIADGTRPDSLTKILEGKNPGTHFIACGKSASTKKRWLAHFGRSIGKVFVDAGAAAAIRTKGGSLLSAGVKSFAGKFQAGALVEIVDVSNGDVVARGLAQVDCESLESELSKKGERKPVIVVHRDNLALV